jgi:hypothetical protein
MALASSTQLEALKIILGVRGDQVDQELQDLLTENGQIIESVRKEGLQDAGQ